MRRDQLRVDAEIAQHLDQLLALDRRGVLVQHRA